MSNQGNGGRYSKFQQRLRNIRLSRSKRAQFLKENEAFVQERLKEIRKVVGQESISVPRRPKVAGEPEIVVSKKEKKQADVIVFDPVKRSKVGVQEEFKKVSKEERKETISNDLDLKVQEIREKKPKIPSTRKGYVYQREVIKPSDFRKYSDEEKREQLDLLGAEILSKIKGQFEDHLDELEVLMSELYFLEKGQETEIELKKVKETKKEINQLIERINAIIDQYNLYKKNYYIDHVIGIDDNVIVDNMISYRTLLDDVSLEKDFVKGYKALDEFKQLYQNLDAVRGKVIALRDENEEKIEQFDIRDKKYNEIKLGVVKVDDVLKNCDEEMDRQNQYFSDLMLKINKIDREEYKTYHLRGIYDLISQSARYLGFLMLSPLSGLLPGIGVRTLATRRMVGNVYRKLHYEEVQHVHYSAVNYDSEISRKLTDIDYTSGVIDDTLKDIERLRETFMLQYDSRIPGYEATLKKIDKIEHNVIRSQNRVEKIRERLRTSKKLNEKKMIKVRELNNNS